ncbi:cytochrome P450 [Stackebrandtia soli]|uniref:cytochrome P450 n=1 Tax=Stackebrandtia soli TaxID=1892856 RepID=UPI0039E7A44E
MTDAVEVPLHMARDRFTPSDDLAALRERGELAKVRATLGVGDAWLVTRYADIRTALADADTFSNNTTEIAAAQIADLSTEEVERLRKGQLLGMDAPDHTRLRRLLTPEFTMRRIRQLEPRITEIVTDHLDELERLGPGADLVAHFALPIPSLVICELLGVPYEDRAEFQERSSRQLDTSLSEPERRAKGFEMRAYMAELVARAQAEPGDDMLGMLVRDHGDAVDTDELINVAGLLLTAGHETTANMLGLGTYALLSNPEELVALRRNLEDASYVNQAIEELLRFLSVVHAGVPRVATRDIELAGQLIRAGEQVLFGLSAANHDPDFIDEPGILRLDRKTAPHVAFGHGAHHCLGAPLARAELRIAFPALLRRFPDLRLADSVDDVRFRPHQVIYGVETLPVAWGPA